MISCLLAVLVSSCKTANKYGTGVAQEVGSLWTLVADDPPTYVPKGYPAGAPRPKAKGKWITSKKTDARFFVPESGTSEMDSATLRRSAIRAIDPADKSRNKAALYDVGETIVIIPLSIPFLLNPYATSATPLPWEMMRGSP